MHLTSFPSLKDENIWLPKLRDGDGSALRAALKGADEVAIFKLGMASAERDLLGGVQAALQELGSQHHEHLVSSMGRHWLEASILCQAPKVANYLRAWGIDPMLPRDRTKERYAGVSFNSRMISRVDEVLSDIMNWDETFIEQFTTSQLQEVALFRAIHHHSQDVVARLIELGADINKEAEGYKPLWAAVRSGKAPVLSMILEAGASLEEVGLHTNKTLLVAACERGLEACVWTLLKHGACLSDRSCGMDAPQAARAAGHDKLASKLEAYGLSQSPQARCSTVSRRL